MKNKFKALKNFIKKSIYDILFVLLVFIILILVSNLSFGQSILNRNTITNVISLFDLTAIQKGLHLKPITLTYRNVIVMPGCAGLFLFSIK